MKTILENIIKECVDKGIKVSTETRDGELAYKVEGFSKSGNALIYAGEDSVIYETRYGQKDSLLNFSDLVLVAKCWYENYKNKSPFENPEPEWASVLADYYNSGSKENPFEDLKDLPF